MASEFPIGCTYNFLQSGADIAPLERFRRVRDTGAFDYLHWLPPAEILSDCVAASEKTDLPMLTGNVIHRLGINDERLTGCMDDAARAGLKLVNVMLNTCAANGHELTDDEIVSTYLRMAEAGDRAGVALAFELHVDCWSEKYKRVTPVIRQVRAAGAPFGLTIDYSHVVFKIDNPDQLEISDVREDVEQGRIVLDPFDDDCLLAEWLSLDAVSFAQFRPAVPDNPRNIWGKNPDGSTPRGIMYPFERPGPGEWHTRWEAWRLEVCKEAFRRILRYHLTQAESPLRFAITEMIGTSDYGMGAGFSLLEQNAACARWIREERARLAAMHKSGIPLSH